MRDKQNELYKGILDSLPFNIAILDMNGDIQITNAAWMGFCLENSGELAKTGEGVNYLQVCEEAEGAGSEGAKQACDGIRRILQNESSYFAMEYPCDSPTRKQWFMMTATPLKTPAAGVIISHMDITDRHMIEEEQIRIINNIQHLAMTDSLTGLGNRRSIENRLLAEINRAARTGQNLSIILADMDDLKEINDTYGHRYGDLALKEVAKSMIACKRDYDFIGRYGGDEFLLILPNTIPGKAVSIAERFRKCVNEIGIPPGKKEQKKISISLGIYDVMPTGQEKTPLEEIIDYADKALYLAKQSGKNKVAEYKKTQ